MANYFEMNRDELVAEQEKLKEQYKKFQDMHLKLNMARGKPGPFTPVDLAVQCGRPLLMRRLRKLRWARNCSPVSIFPILACEGVE